jgi:4-hydroxy-4-methyl-2-oxoglutarate aldolase
MRNLIDDGVEDAVGEPVQIGNVVLRRGESIVGDSGAIVVIPARRVAQIVAESEGRRAPDINSLERICDGELTLDSNGFHGDSVSRDGGEG